MECQWKDSHSSHLVLRRLGHIDNHALLEEIDYELSRLRWPPFACSTKQITFQACDEGYRLGLSLVASPELVSLYQKVNFALHRAGLPTPRKRFIPFIELGLMAAGHENTLKNWLNHHALFSLPAFTIDHLSLIEDHNLKTYGQFTLLEEYGRLPGVHS